MQEGAGWPLLGHRLAHSLRCDAAEGALLASLAHRLYSQLGRDVARVSARAALAQRLVEPAIRKGGDGENDGGLKSQQGERGGGYSEGSASCATMQPAAVRRGRFEDETVQQCWHRRGALKG